MRHVIACICLLCIYKIIFDFLGGKGNNKSFLIVPVRKVNLSVIITPITVVVGQQITLTCITSYCIPPAYITWYKSAGDITSLSSSTIANSGGLVKTTSSVQSTIVKEDNGKRVFCKASNIRGKEVSSFMNILNVMCKYLKKKN